MRPTQVSEQTVGWLGWLARRMKEHGHTLFAVEQLQPGWLGSVRQQFGYFMATRLLGLLGLVLLFLLWNHSLKIKVALGGLAVAQGLTMGVIDFGFARLRPGRGNRASQRFWTLLAGMIVTAAVYFLILTKVYSGDPPELIGFSMLFLVMAGFAFCMPLDVRTLDVQPTASMRWNWRMALKPGLVGLSAMIMVVSCFFLAFLVAQLIEARSLKFFDLRELVPFLVGVGVGAVSVVWYWIKARPPARASNLLIAGALPFLVGEIASALAHAGEFSAWAFLLIQATPAAIVGVFSGFASTSIDPARGRHAGVWFWLRVPVMMLGLVGLVMIIPGFVMSYTSWENLNSGGRVELIYQVLSFAIGAGLVAFFRFGGFNGVQHFFLRWLLVRSGNLPRKAETFYDHAAKLALLQKVGFGYRFIHALLLDHLAARAPAAEGRLDHSAGS